jgi:hypothetical protein
LKKVWADLPTAVRFRVKSVLLKIFTALTSKRLKLQIFKALRV